MKLIIAGSRHFNTEKVYAELVSLRIANHQITSATEIVSGHAKGVDTAGERYADFYDIPVKLFPAEWNRFGRSAGPLRNGKMADYADTLLLVWDGNSRGSANMKMQMLAKGKPVYEVILDEA